MTDIAGDLNDIAALKARYCALADLCAQEPERARGLFPEVLAPNATGDYGMGAMARDAIVEFLATAIAQNSEWMWHALSSPRISVDGDRASGLWTVMVESKRRGAGQMTVHGRYTDAFVRTPEGWLISAVRFRRAGEEIDL